MSVVTTCLIEVISAFEDSRDGNNVLLKFSRALTPASEATEWLWHGNLLSASFVAPLAALECASQVRLIFDRNALMKEFGFAVRTVILCHGEETQSTAIRRARSIIKAAVANQILVCAATHELTRRELRPHQGFEDLGGHYFNGLQYAERLFEFQEPDFNAIGRLTRPTTDLLKSLPRRSSFFIGRERDLERFEELFEQTRILTITGPPGCGKTSLALRITRLLATPEWDAICWFELTPDLDEESAWTRVAHLLDVPRASGKAGALEVIGGQRVLVVLDNCDANLAVASEVASAVASCGSSCAIIATSRRKLSLSGELAMGIAGLDLPESGRERLELSTLQTDAVALFVDRATSASPEFELTEDNLEPVIAICRKLDGLPLALELAAAKTRTFSPKELLQHLDKDFGFLDHASHKPSRGSLSRAITGSLKHLGQAEAQVLVRLSTFSGAFSSAMACDLCADLCTPAIAMDVLEILVEGSLLSRLEDAFGVAQFRMLSPIREFVLHSSREELERTEAWQHFMVWATRFVQDLVAALASGSEALALRKIDFYYTTIGEAISRARQKRDHRAFEQFLSLLGPYWARRGMLPSLEGMLEETLAALGQGSPRIQAVCLNLLGLIALIQRKAAVATDRLERACAQALSAGMKSVAGAACANLASIQLQQDHVEEALQTLQRAISLLDPAEDSVRLSTVMVNRAAVLVEEAKRETTIEKVLRASSAVSTAESHVNGNASAGAFARQSLLLLRGDLALLDGNLALAKKAFVDSVSLCAEHNMEADAQEAIEDLGLLALEDQDYHMAATLLGFARHLRSKHGNLADLSRQTRLTAAISQVTERVGGRSEGLFAYAALMELSEVAHLLGTSKFA